MNLRITNPPRTVLISGIPLCFAYKAYSFTNKLAVIAKHTYAKVSALQYEMIAKPTENAMKKKIADEMRISYL